MTAPAPVCSRSLTSALCLADSHFGPQSPCRSFDFTVTFEASILLILPSAVFIFVAAPYIWVAKPWRKFDTRIAKDPRSIGILLSFVLLLCAGVSSLILWLTSSPSLPTSTVHLVTSALALMLASSSLFVILGLAAITSKTTAFLLGLYQFISLILQTAPLRTFILDGGRSTSAVFLLSFSATSLVVIALSIPGQRVVGRLSEGDGLFHHLFVLWALPLMWKGRRGDADIDYELHPEMDCTKLYLRFKLAWDREMEQHPSHPLLVRALFCAFYPNFLSTVPPALLRALAQVFVSSYSLGSRPQPSQWGWALAGVFTLVFLVLSGATSLYLYSLAKTGAYIRGALIESIFRKALVLRAGSVTDATGGDPLNLMSSDVERITTHLDLCHQIWTSFIIIILGLYILHSQLGLGPLVAALPIILLVIILTPLLSRKIGPLEGNITALCDKRVRLVTSILRQINGIKLAALETEMENRVRATRTEELGARKKFWDRFAIVVALTSTTLNFLSLFTLGTYSIFSFLGHVPPLSTARLFTAYTTLTIISASLFVIGQGLPAVTQAYVSVQRIEKFLSSPDYKHYGDRHLSNLDAPKVFDPSVLELEKPQSVFLHLPNSASSLLSVPARDEGEETLSLHAARIAWGDKVVLDGLDTKICLGQLTMIIGRVASGKSTLLATLLGETDILSGRAFFPPEFRRGIAYCSQNPWLQGSLSVRDNIVFASAMDQDWYARVLSACALETDFGLTPGGDLVLARGLSGGQKARVALARAVYSRLEVVVLDDVFAALDSHTSNSIFFALFGTEGLLRGKTVAMATNQLAQLRHSDWIIALHEQGEVQSGTYLEFLATDNVTGDLIRENVRRLDSLDSEEILVDRAPMESTPVFLQVWSTFNDTHSAREARSKTGVFLGSYAIFEVFYSIAITALFYYVIMGVSLRASANLHSGLFSGLMKASIEFFSTTHPGQIISRFSQDMFVLDELFPISFYDFGYQLMRVVGSAILMIISVPYLLLNFTCIPLSDFSRQLGHCKKIASLGSCEQSSVVHTFSGNSGLERTLTIRAAHAQKRVTNSNTTLLTGSQRPFYLTTIASVWFASSIGVMTATINTAIVILAVATRRNINSGLLAVGLTQAVSLQDTITLMLTSWTQLEVSAVALERNLQYSNLPPEQDTRSNSGPAPQGVWPFKGDVKFTNVFARYTADGQPVLHGISFHVPAGKKLGLVGRSAAGKSTILLALLRALHTEGNIYIDDVNIMDVSKYHLRKHINYIAQSPFVLAGTVRQNVDISGRNTDAEIWAALEAVQLKPTITAFEGALDYELTPSGQALSQGQLQLLAMARALLCGSKLAIFDEVTANIDPETDAIIQNVIRSSFQDCTMLVIVHRLENIKDFDQVIVLDAGRIVESGKPSALLQEESRGMPEALTKTGGGARD
ncbi:P-loop containing nucleoside triphosphate hydrolase protein [Mycena rosella]|uniref:P-loop containing nucleoside triphosphate hydrolase protein n=1 Tax=Mycena rosella TaxID=1033263 RepID=A0AAD7G898_MYCRO|nr:P-loop containing nucleoside triphosphate hydrolase protein [Mycena rosella]